MADEPHWLSTAQAAEILGVKAATVYAYVSRGQLSRHPGPDGRTSRFDRGEVRRLAARTRHGGRAGSLDVVLDTGLSLLVPDGALYYRGHDATALARTHRFEDVAELLWTDVPDAVPDAGSPGTGRGGAETASDGPDAGEGGGMIREAWEAPPSALAVGRGVQRALPGTVRP
ncbi:MAG: citrate synthase, partial [Actinocatenispora sp.]